METKMQSIILPLLLSVAVALWGTAPTTMADAAGRETAGDLRLLGTAVADPPGANIAVIQTRNGEQAILRTNGRVGAYQVRSIVPGHILLQNDQLGQVTLRVGHWLEGDGTVLSAQQANLPKPTIFRPPPQRAFETVHADADSIAVEIEDGRPEMKVETVQVYGMPAGFRISPIKPGGVFSALGLRTGDIVKEFNGRPVYGAQDADVFLNQIASGGQFDIKVKGRRTRTIRLVVN